MKKYNLIMLLALLTSTVTFSQVGINTKNPQQTLHIDGAKNNPTSGAPSAAQSVDDFVVKSTGQVGIGTAAPNDKAILDLTSADKGILLPRVALVSKTNPLPVNATAAGIPVGLIVMNTTTNATVGQELNPNQLYKWSGTQWDELVDKSSVEELVNGALSGAGIPRIVFKGNRVGQVVPVPSNIFGDVGSRILFDEISGSNAGDYSTPTRAFTVTEAGLYRVIAGWLMVNNSGQIREYITQINDALGASDIRNLCSPCSNTISITSVRRYTVGQTIALKLFSAGGDPSTEVSNSFIIIEKLE